MTGSYKVNTLKEFTYSRILLTTLNHYKGAEYSSMGMKGVNWKNSWICMQCTRRGAPSNIWAMSAKDASRDRKFQAGDRESCQF